MSWLGAAVAGGAGLLIGGYVTMLIQRVPAARTISGSLRELTRRPLAECPHCAAGRPATDLVPLPGWARTGSVCRDCGERPGAWRPAAELLTAALSALIGLRFGLSPVLPAYLFLVAVAVALAFIDVRHQRLPDLLTLPPYLVAFVLLGVAAPAVRHGTSHLIHAFIGLACASAFYLILALVYPAGIGWGDVKLSGLLGLYLGWIGPAALVIGLSAGFVLAAMAGVGLIAVGKATRKSQIAFGPFMLAGTLAVIACLGPAGQVTAADSGPIREQPAAGAPAGRAPETGHPERRAPPPAPVTGRPPDWMPLAQPRYDHHANRSTIARAAPVMKRQWLAGRAARPYGCRRIHRYGPDRRRPGHDDVRHGRSRSFPYSISSANAGSVTASCRQWNPPYPEKAQAVARMDLPVHSQTDTGKARKTIVKDARPVCAHVY